MHFVFISDEELKSFIELAKRVSDQIVELNKMRVWPKQCTGCGPYSMFGQPGRLCEYRTLCNEPDWHDVERFYSKGEPFHPFKLKRENKK